MRLPLIAAALLCAFNASAADAPPAQLGPRPFFLVEDMSPGPLKTELQACAQRPVCHRPSHAGSPQIITQPPREGAGANPCWRPSQPSQNAISAFWCMPEPRPCQPH